MTPANAKYHLLEPLITQSYASRVLALFYAAMQQRGYNVQNFEKPENLNCVIEQMSSAQYLQLMENVRKQAFTLNAWTGLDSNDNSIEDIEFRTMCRYLRQIELFLTIRYAVKHGDIGLLEYCISPSLIFFLGAGQHNYAYEMLYYTWILRPTVSANLRHSIMTADLVNWPGRPGCFKAIDLGMKHLNGGCKMKMKCYKNSTKDTHLIFDRVCLSNTWVHSLRRELETAFDHPARGDHTRASTILKIFSTARSLLTSGLARPRDKNLLPSNAMFDSLNIMEIGVNALETKVKLFNESWVNQQGFPSESDENMENMTTVHEHIKNYSRVLDDQMNTTCSSAHDALLIDELNI